MGSNNLKFGMTVQEVNDAYSPVYSPLYSILNGVKHVREEGDVTLKSSQLLGDLEAAKILPQDTESKVFQIGDKKKLFNKFFYELSFTSSGLQKPVDVPTIAARVVDRHTAQLDKLIWSGIGNNGLAVSADVDYISNTSVALGATPSVDDLATYILNLVKQSEQLVGNGSKYLIAYGAVKALFTKFIAGTSNPSTYKQALISGGVLPSTIELIEAPSNLDYDFGTSGLLLVAEQLVDLHYTEFPQLDDQGQNAEANHMWLRFLFGSAMVEVKEYGAIIKAPATLS